MRQVILDTETTGLDPAQGHRIVEIGCVEMKNRRKTGRTFHHYVNPERDIEEGAYGVHGISHEDLQGKPIFKDIAREFIDFIRDSEVIIHNAPFDVAFLNAELAILDEQWGAVEDYCRIIDTLTLARELHPGQKNSLDALCTRYEVDNSQRDLHGGLLDAQILSDVYLAMTGGQASLLLDDEVKNNTDAVQNRDRPVNQALHLAVIEPGREELTAHSQMLDLIENESRAGCLWKKKMLM